MNWCAASRSNKNGGQQIDMKAFDEVVGAVIASYGLKQSLKLFRKSTPAWPARNNIDLYSRTRLSTAKQSDYFNGRILRYNFLAVLRPKLRSDQSTRRMRSNAPDWIPDHFKS